MTWKLLKNDFVNTQHPFTTVTGVMHARWCRYLQFTIENFAGSCGFNVNGDYEHNEYFAVFRKIVPSDGEILPNRTVWVYEKLYVWFETLCLEILPWVMCPIVSRCTKMRSNKIPYLQISSWEWDWNRSLFFDCIVIDSGWLNFYDLYGS